MAEYLIQDSTLTEIADAIRSKNGKSESISVKNMAQAISALSIGDGSSKNIIMASGKVIGGTDKTITIQHNLNVVPDVFIIYAQTSVFNGDSKEMYYIQSAGNFSKNISMNSNIKGWISTKLVHGTTSDENAGLDDDPGATGIPRNATSTTVQVGGTFYLAPSQDYVWIAISGLS